MGRRQWHTSNSVRIKYVLNETNRIGRFGKVAH